MWNHGETKNIVVLCRATQGSSKKDSRRANGLPVEAADRSPASARTASLFWPVTGSDSKEGASGPRDRSRAQRKSPFANKLAAVLAFRRLQSRGNISRAATPGGDTANLEVEAGTVLHVEAGRVISERGAQVGGQHLHPADSSGNCSVSSTTQSTADASSSAWRGPELSAEEQRLLQGTASSTVAAMLRAADLSAFAEVPDIPAWRKPPPRLPHATLRESFMKKRADPERTIKTITRDR